MVHEQTAEIKYGRRAFGHQRRMTPQEKARNVAISIAQRQDEHREWTWETFGLEHNPAQQALVWQELMGL